MPLSSSANVTTHTKSGKLVSDEQTIIVIPAKRIGAAAIGYQLYLR